MKFIIPITIELDKEQLEILSALHNKRQYEGVIDSIKKLAELNLIASNPHNKKLWIISKSVKIQLTPLGQKIANLLELNPEFEMSNKLVDLTDKWRVI